MSKRFAITLIIVLVALNLGFVWFAYSKIKTSASGLTSSANSAASSTADSTSFVNSLKLSLGKKEIPAADLAGNDLGGLTRTRGDVRSGFTQNANGTATAEYKTTTAANIILSYYRTQLARSSWIMQSATDEKIVFSKDNQIITISASTNSNGITTYTVTL